MKQILKDAHLILERALILNEFAKKYEVRGPELACVHSVGTSDDEGPRVTFYTSDMHRIGLVFGIGGWERQMSGPDTTEFVRIIDRVEVTIFNVEKRLPFVGRQPVTPDEFIALALPVEKKETNVVSEPEWPKWYTDGYYVWEMRSEESGDAHGVESGRINRSAVSVGALERDKGVKRITAAEVAKLLKQALPVAKEAA